MDQYVGLDVALKETSISVRQDRKRIWRGKCPSHPKAVAEAIREHAPDAVLLSDRGARRAMPRHPLIRGGPAPKLR